MACLHGAHAAGNETAWYVEGGKGDRPVLAASAGWMRDLGLFDAGSRWRLGLEAGAGAWHSKANGGFPSRTFGRVGVTPNLRYAFGDDRALFVEAGIGLDLIAPKFSVGNKRFGSVFQFNDHVAVGMRFGPARQHELSLRVDHYSNAGIKHPNPGQNFGELRYARYY